MNVFPEFFIPLLGGLLLAAVLPAQSPATGGAKPADAETGALLAKVAAARAVVAKSPQPTLVCVGKYGVAFEGVDADVAKGGATELFHGAELARCTSDVGQFGAMEKGLHRDVAWEVDPSMGAKVLRGDSAAAMRRYFALLRGDDPRRTYKSWEKTGTQPWAGAEHVVVRMTPAEGRPDTWWIAANGDVSRVDIALPAPESADAAFGMSDLLEAQIHFLDWTDVAGGRFAKKRELRMGKATVTTTWSSITVGETIEPAKFALPEAVAKLKNAPVQPAQDAAGKSTFQVLDRTEQPVASIRAKVKASEISKQLAILLPEVGMHLNAVGAQPAGAPFTRYHGEANGEVDLEAGIPVQKPFEAKGRVQNSKLPGGKTVTYWHIGPYDKLPAAHDALAAHLAAKGLKARGGVFEIYWTDPGMVPDPAKWKTQLFAPIE